MNLYYMSIFIVVISNILYHICQKSIPENVNPITSLIATYATALIFSVIAFFVYPSKQGFLHSFKDISWASFVLGLGIIGLELGFLLVYRSGWNMSLASLVANVMVAILLIPIGLFAYKEHLSTTNVLGILLCIGGLILLFKK